MKPRSLDQILKEIGTVYQPQIQTLQKRQASLPDQIKAEEQGLQAKQEQAFGDILSGARRRGTGIAFGGIPLGEQAKYTSTEFLPALARLKQAGREQALSLEDAIAQIRERQQTQALGIRQYEQQRYDDYQKDLRDREEARRAAAASAVSPTLGSATLGSMSGGSGGVSQRKDKGFNFTDPNGRPISAAVYARINDIPFRSLLQRMADLGDAGAKQALSFVGDDFGYDPRKVTSSSLANLYNSLIWGTGLAQARPSLQVSTAQPNQRISVGVAQPNQRITF